MAHIVPVDDCVAVKLGQRIVIIEKRNAVGGGFSVNIAAQIFFIILSLQNGIADVQRRNGNPASKFGINGVKLRKRGIHICGEICVGMLFLDGLPRVGSVLLCRLNQIFKLRSLPLLL